MQEEAIRAFRKTWNPRATHQQQRRASRAALTLAATSDPGIRRASLAHPLPPPSAAALNALAPSSLDDGSGVRRRPQQRDTELEDLSHALEECKTIPFPQRSLAPPKPPRAAQLKAKRLHAAPLDPQRNAREPTDPHVHILAVYALPPLPPKQRRDAFLPVDPDWLEVIDEVSSADVQSLDISSADWPGQDRKRGHGRRVDAWLSRAKRSLNIAWLSGVICVASAFGVAGDGSSIGAADSAIAPMNATTESSLTVLSTPPMTALQWPTTTIPKLTAESILQGPVRLQTAAAEPARSAAVVQKSARKRHLGSYYDVIKRSARKQRRSQH